MKSLDANILLRMLLRDDPAQQQAAEKILSSPTMLLSTVVLEIVWVLNSGRNWSRERIADGIEAVLAIEQLVAPDSDALRWATGCYRNGGDFSDLVHVALSGRAEAFVTFDRGIDRYAKDPPAPIETIYA